MCALPKGTDGLRCDDQSLMNTAEALGVTLRTPYAATRGTLRRALPTTSSRFRSRSITTNF